MFVLGTAGHVDHGKSTLIKTLTGIDPDRLREEKERQMTIDLGFAWLDLPSGREIGIVDVPGHRDFIENMLVGVGGIDAVLLIIAADEGIMPQTREHLAIIDLLEIKNGIIVLTKTDLVNDDEWLALVTEEIESFVEGTCLSRAAVIPVSSINGQGIDQLTTSIDNLFEIVSPKRDIGKPRLPIDRVFSLKGFGTVVTGTLLDGKLKVGQQVVVLPSGIETRIRGIQTHKKQTSEVYPGTRTALNLVGVDVEELQRGDVVTIPNTLAATRRIDMRFRMLKDAGRKLVHDEFLKVFSGTTQTYARVRVIAAEEFYPGQEGWLQLEFRDEIMIGAGDHCILRRPSPPETIGGGVILDAFPKKRHKRFSVETVRHFELMQSGDVRGLALGLLEKSGSLTIESIKNQLGLSSNELDPEIGDLMEKGEIVGFKNDTPASTNNMLLVHKNWVERWKNQIVHLLKEYHKTYPLRAGMKKDMLRSEMKISPRLFSSFLEYALVRQLIGLKQDIIYLPDHLVEFNEEHKKNIEKILSLFQKTPYLTPSYNDLATDFGEDLVSVLIDRGELIRTSEQIIFRKTEFDEMLAFTNKCLDAEGSIEIGELRDKFKTSRKYALSFLEYLDSIGHTERKEDIRILRTG